MKEKFNGKLDVNIYTIDSEEARGYLFRSSTNVLFEDEWLPLDVATDRQKMEEFLSKNINGGRP
nr:hypothetical protein [Desulfatiglans anilini]